MLACVARAKPEEEEEETTSNKDAVKSLSSQLKDMVLRFSGAYRQCKGGRRRPQNNDDDDGTSLRAERSISTSTPAWDMSSGTSEGRGKDTWVSSDQEIKDVDEQKEWIAQVEPGVQITLVSLTGGAGNDLKRIRFSREVFSKWQAQRWWGENYDRIMELYNVHKLSSQQTSPRSNDGQEVSGGLCLPSVPDPTEHIMYHHLRPRDTTGGETACSSNIGSREEIVEWVEQDEPGVYITIREMIDGGRELRRVRFSRGRFGGERRAKLWLEENIDRIQEQYL